MKRLITLLFLTGMLHSATAQTTCAVLLESIKGTYEGDCKNGKATGQGKAVGIDNYEGEFKIGLPEGKGKYTWKNGDVYEGGWKKGMKDGKGELKTIENNVASVTSGYWKKDKYIGEHENPYKIISAGSQIGRVQVNNIDEKRNSVSVTVSNTARANIFMTDFQITRGSYERKTNSRLSGTDITIFQHVIFPFGASFNFGGSILQIVIYEKGEWEIIVPILN